MVDAENSLIWAEQFVYTSKFTSSRLENVWWLPYENSDTRVAVSNTSASTVTVTLTVDGTSPHQSSPTQITLSPWQTRVLDIMEDIVGHQNGHIHDTGGISITHTGNPGAVLARMFISKPDKGYSATANFIDPESTGSQKWNGSGLRLKNLNGGDLDPVLVARNNGSQTSHVHGRIIYTDPSGSVQTVNISQFSVSAGSTKLVDLDNLVNNLPSSVGYAGIELEYDTPKGTIVTSVQSVSQNGEHVFQVPMFDPQNMPSSAGGFPWKADGDYTTLVYIKNETDSAKKYAVHLIYDGGGYSLGIKKLEGGQTIAVDFRELRDSQTPDSVGNIIPLNVDKGQIAWGVHGAENKVLTGRSEQISVANGVASTYACYNPCPPVINDVWINPDSVITSVGDTTALTGTQTEINNYGQVFGPYASESVAWTSFDTNVATIGFDGYSEAVGAGFTNIQGTWDRTIWFDWGLGLCEPFTDQMTRQAPMEVRPPSVSFSEIGSVEAGASKNITATVSNRGNYQITLFLRKSNNQSTNGVSFEDGSSTKVLPNNNGNHSVTVKGINASGQLDDYKIEARYDNNIYLAGQKLFSVSTVLFEKAADCSGFDDTVQNQTYLSVPKSGSNTVKAKISPNGATGTFNFQAQTGITVSPTSISSGEQTLTVAGGTNVGTFTLKALANQSTEAAATLNVVVRKRIDKTVVIHAVTEDDDDVQVVPVGSTGNQLDICVGAGSNNFRDTVPSGDDQVLTNQSIEYISFGANGVCNTTAKNTDTAPPSSANIPTATALQTALNNTYWGKQANVYFTVSTDAQAHQFNFDLNRNGNLDPSEGALFGSVFDINYNLNLYYQGLSISGGNAFTSLLNRESFFESAHNGTVEYVAGHEIGHSVENSGSHSTSLLDLMYEEDLPNSPCRIRKRDWDLIDAANP